MIRPRNFGALLIPFISLTLVGCTMPKMTIEEFRAMQPEKPAELEHLNMFVGKWRIEGTGNFAMLEEPVSFTGQNTAKWGGDGWYLTYEETMSMADMDPMQGMGIWSYDPRTGKYLSYWAGSMGSGTGDSTYDADTRTWHMRATGNNPHGKSKMKGTVRFLDDDTMQWTFTESMGLMKIMDMTATGRRVE